MVTPKISIVVPVRNGSHYLRNCVQYIENQSFKNIEVIFVVDAHSEDDSVQLAEKIVSEKDNYKLIIQNSGMRQGGNRNLGLRKATGSEIWFLDVDDAPSPLFLEKMHEALSVTDSDFVCCNFNNVSPKGVPKTKNRPGQISIMNREEAIRFCNYGRMPIAPWSKLFKTSFLKNSNIEFEDIGAEDVLFTYTCLKSCKQICALDEALYAYRMTSNSVCRNTLDLDLRGKEEIQAYSRVEALFKDDQETALHCAVMKMRSSTHMTLRTAISFAKSNQSKESYNLYLKKLFEGKWHRYLPRTYFIAVRIYVKLIYKRPGSIGVHMKLHSGITLGDLSSTNK